MKPQPHSAEFLSAGRTSVVLLTAPAGAGKTRTVLEWVGRQSGGLARPRCLLIAPNAPAAEQFRRRLLDAAPGGVLIGPAVTTFAGLAGGVLASAATTASPLSNLQRRLLLARIVQELFAAGKLKTLGGLAHAPGLTDALDTAIAELKRAAVEPEDLARAAAPAGKDADLVAVYRAYQQALLAQNRYDAEGLIWLARNVLQQNLEVDLGQGPIETIALDGFTDFTPTQMQIIRLLGLRRRVLVTLPLADEPLRQRLWFWTGRTRDRLLREIPGLEQVSLPADEALLPGLFDLAGDAAAKVPPSAGAAVEIDLVHAPDVDAEVRYAAQEIKADLLAGARPGSIAVIARSLEGYQEPIARIFARCHIPLAGWPEPLAACSIVRFVLDLLRLGPRYDSHELLACIRNSYFDPSALGPFDPAAVDWAERAIRESNVLQGPPAYVEAIACLVRRRRAQLADDESAAPAVPGEPDADAAIAHLGQARDLLAALMARLDRLGQAKTVADYAQAVRDLVADLRLSQAAMRGDQDERIARDLRALAALDHVLTELGQSGLAVEPDPRQSGSGSDLVTRAAQVATCPPARGESVVAVLDALDARALRFDRVFLLGLNEKTFPHLAQERCLISETDRLAWRRAGLELDRRSDLVAREMLLFYLCATRARRLTVSLLTGGSSGKASTASVFVEELLGAARRAGATVKETILPPGRYIPPMERLCNADDALTAAAHAAFEGDATAKPLLGFVAEHRKAKLIAASFGILATDRRWRTAPADAFDGRLADTRLRAELARRFPGEHVFSATELNSYAQCPWQFFARYLLRLEPLRDPEPQMTPVAQGIFCHAVLWQLMTDLSARLGGPVLLAREDRASLRAALAAAVEIHRQRLADQAVYSRLWTLQTQYWQEQLWQYLVGQCEGKNPQAGPARNFELGFGLTRRMGPSDPASVADPVTLTAGEISFRLHGKIDRVDLVDERPLAVDYKSGGVPTGGDILDGRDLQLALYVRALEQIFAGPCAGGEYHDLRNVRTVAMRSDKLPRGCVERELDFAGLMEQSMACAGQYIMDMADGHFEALPETCSSWCPYRQICHYSPHRATRKGEARDTDAAASHAQEADDE